jgi:alpha-tubulin suppressor-like RCC1 family protein
VAWLGLATPAPAAGTASTATAISDGGDHTCAITAAGGVKCWGFNEYGQVGDGTTTYKPTPVDVSGLTSGVAAIEAGYRHTCALTSSGGVKCWGDNFFGQLGDGTTKEKLTPVDVAGLTSGIAAVSTGIGYHTCALTSAGEVKCWGDNEDGQLGDGSNTGPEKCTPNTPCSTTPVDVSGLTSGVTAIAAGYMNTCLLTNAGGVKCWGDNEDGQLGDGTKISKLTPVDVSGLTSGVAAISGREDHTCAITSAAGAECWGEDEGGSLGDGSSDGPEKCQDLEGEAFPCSDTPVDVSGLTSGVAAISAGGAQTCAVTAAGGAKCWGENEYGELGDGSKHGPEKCRVEGEIVSCSRTPVDVSGLTRGVAAVSSGVFGTCALTSVGWVKCWGSLTLASEESRTPVDVRGLAVAPCTTSTGMVKLSPGLSNTPAVQTMQIKGTFEGCTGEPFTEVKYTASLKTAAAVSCSVLTAGGEAATGPAKYKWTPKAKPTKGTLSLLLSEASGVALSGELTSGTYAPRTLSGTITESYSGAATCSTKPVKKGTFSGSTVNFE